MEMLLSVALVAIAVVLLACAAAYAYVDAQKYDMNAKKWAALSFFVPFFGVFAYLFERDELTRTEREFVTEGPFEIHESRADDVAFDFGGDTGDDEDE